MTRREIGVEADEAADRPILVPAVERPWQGLDHLAAAVEGAKQVVDARAVGLGAHLGRVAQRECDEEGHGLAVPFRRGSEALDRRRKVVSSGAFFDPSWRV